MVLQHTLIRRSTKPGSTGYVMTKIGYGEMEYASLSQLVSEESARLRVPCARAT